MKGHALCTSAITLLALVVGPGLAGAQDLGPSYGEPYRKNSLSIGAGSLNEDSGEDSTQITLEYVRWMDPNFGVGVDVDFADDDMLVREWALAVPFHIRFAKYFDAYAGPGYEWQNENIVGTEDDTDFFFRLGLGAEFDLGQSGWFVEPSVDADLFRHDQSYYFGVAIGKEF